MGKVGVDLRATDDVSPAAGTATRSLRQLKEETEALKKSAQNVLQPLINLRSTVMAVGSAAGIVQFFRAVNREIGESLEAFAKVDDGFRATTEGMKAAISAMKVEVGGIVANIAGPLMDVVKQLAARVAEALRQKRLIDEAAGSVASGMVASGLAKVDEQIAAVAKRIDDLTESARKSWSWLKPEMKDYYVSELEALDRVHAGLLEQKKVLADISALRALIARISATGAEAGGIVAKQDADLEAVRDLIRRKSDLGKVLELEQQIATLKGWAFENEARYEEARLAALRDLIDELNKLKGIFVFEGGGPEFPEGIRTEGGIRPPSYDFDPTANIPSMFPNYDAAEISVGGAAEEVFEIFGDSLVDYAEMQSRGYAMSMLTAIFNAMGTVPFYPQGAGSSDLTAFGGLDEVRQLGERQTSGLALGGVPELGLDVGQYSQPQGSGGGGVPSAFTDALGQAAIGLGGFVGGVAQSVATLGPWGLLLEAIKPVLAGMLQVLAPAVEQILAPLMGALVVVGQLVGSLLAPVFQILGLVLDPLVELFIGAYNFLLPVFNFLGKGLSYIAVAVDALSRPFEFVGDLLAWFGDWIKYGVEQLKVFFWNVAHPFNQREGGLDRPDPFSSDAFTRALVTAVWTDLQEIGPGTLTAAGTDYIADQGGYIGQDGTSGGAGSTTTVQQVPDIYVYNTFAGPVIGAGGASKVGEYIAQTLKEFAGIGGRIHILQALE